MTTRVKQKRMITSLPRLFCLVLILMVFIPYTAADGNATIPNLELTFQPSLAPTMEPFAAPTPSASPTVDPSTIPTFEPSATPTVDPSTIPTFAPPSTIPTFAPSATPTVVQPSAIPTFAPATNLTGEQSLSPTTASAAPTIEPSAPPTVLATAPTIAPTIEPSATVTVQETPQTGNTGDVTSSTPTTEPTLIPRKKDVQDSGSGGLYTVYLIGLVLAVIGTFYFLVRNYGDHFGFNYTPVNTMGDDDDEALNPLNSRDIELARFQRMAESMRSYPPPPGSPRNNRR